MSKGNLFLRKTIYETLEKMTKSLYKKRIMIINSIMYLKIFNQIVFCLKIKNNIKNLITCVINFYKLLCYHKLNKNKAKLILLFFTVVTTCT